MLLKLGYYEHCAVMVFCCLHAYELGRGNYDLVYVILKNGRHEKASFFVFTFMVHQRQEVHFALLKELNH